MTVVAIFIAMAAHARGPLIVGLILMAPFFFAGSMALVANYSPMLSRAVLILLIIGIVVVLILMTLLAIVGSGG